MPTRRPDSVTDAFGNPEADALRGAAPFAYGDLFHQRRRGLQVHDLPALRHQLRRLDGRQSSIIQRRYLEPGIEVVLLEVRVLPADRLGERGECVFLVGGDVIVSEGVVRVLDERLLAEFDAFALS